MSSVCKWNRLRVILLYKEQVTFCHCIQGTGYISSLYTRNRLHVTLVYKEQVTCHPCIQGTCYMSSLYTRNRLHIILDPDIHKWIHPYGNFLCTFCHTSRLVAPVHQAGHSVHCFFGSLFMSVRISSQSFCQLSVGGCGCDFPPF